MGSPSTAEMQFLSAGDRQLWMILQAILNGSVTIGGVVISGSTSGVANNFHGIGASDTFTIPAGAKGWTVAFLSGTGTIGGLAVGVGFSDADTGVNPSDIVITTDAASSAYVRYKS